LGIIAEKRNYERGTMPKCPNCGRETARTADWACQWCGLPLLSGSYRKLDRTYKELLAERRLEQEALIPEELHHEPPLPREPVTEDKPEPAPLPVLEDEPQPTPAPAPIAGPPPEPEPAPAPEPKPEPDPVPEPEPVPEPAPVPEPEAALIPGTRAGSRTGGRA
jgi:outer membrane biosynthesis protein TonB